MTIAEPPAMAAGGSSEPSHADIDRVRALIRRILESGAMDLEANEELELGLPVTVTDRSAYPAGTLEQAVREEMRAFIDELLADGRIDPVHDIRLRYSLHALDSRHTPGNGDIDFHSFVWMTTNDRLRGLAGAVGATLPPGALEATGEEAGDGSLFA